MWVMVMSSGNKSCDHDWYWLAESFEPNGDGETTTKRDWYECEKCGESKVEKTQLPFVKGYARDGSNPLPRWS